jgi:hypothetical protein
MNDKGQNLAPHINKGSTSYSIFMLLFAVVALLVEETKWYYQQYLDFLDIGPYPVPDVTESEMFLFLAIIIHMGDGICDSLKDHWSTTEQFFSPFYCKTMRHGRFHHILRFLPFLKNDNVFYSNGPICDRVWKIRQIFDMPNDTYSKYYTSSKHLALGEVIVLFKGT